MKSIFSLILFVGILVTIYGQPQENLLAEDWGYSLEGIKEIRNIDMDYSYLDALGFLWIDANSDLFRYDGNELISVKNKLGPGNYRTVKIIENTAKDKYFIFENQNMFAKIPIGKFVMEFQFLPRGQLLKDLLIIEDNKYIVLVQEGDKLILSSWNSRNKTFKQIGIYSSRNQDFNQKFLKAGNEIFILNYDQIVVADINDGTVKRTFDIYQNAKPSYMDSRAFLLMDGEDNIIASVPQSGNIFYLSKKGNYTTLNTFSYSKNYKIVNGIWKDQKGNIILSWKNNDGFSTESILLSSIESKDYSIIPAIDRTISSIVSEDFGKYILASGYYGSNILFRKKEQFIQYLNKSIDGDNYLEEGISIRGITAYGDHIYIMREVNNIYKINKISNQVEKLPIVDKNQDTLEAKCINNVVTYDGGLWFSSCTDDDINYIIRYDLSSGISELIEAPGRIRSIALDTINESLILASSQENHPSLLTKFDMKDYQFEGYETNFTSGSKSRFTNVYIYEELILLGTRLGMITVERNGIVSERFKKIEELVANKYITFIEVISDELVIGTINGGVYFYNLKNDEIKNINKESGLISNAICAVILDKNSNYWLSSYNGLYVLDHEKNPVRAYFEKDGINFNEFNRYSYYNEGDKIFFGGVNGFLCIDLNKYSAEKDEDPKINISYSSYYDEDVNDYISEYYNGPIGKIDLTPNQKNLSIQFRSPISKKGYELIRVKVDGVNPHWEVLNEDNKLNLSNLEAGSYTISAEQKGQGYSWEKSSRLEIPISYSQEFYNTDLFKILMAILSVFTVFFVLRQRQLRSQELNQMRQSIASDLHDDLGSIITGIASKAEVAIARKSPEKEDLENVIKDSSMALEMMRDTIWSVNPENDNIGELVDRMKDFAFNMLNHKGIPVNYKINVDREFTLKPIKRRELYLIYKEAITNILKHSEPEVVTIVMNLNKEKFDILIKNDGVMSNHRNTNNGLNMGLNMGLKTMASRAKNLNGSLKTVNENGTFEVSLKASLK